MSGQFIQPNGGYASPSVCASACQRARPVRAIAAAVRFGKWRKISAQELPADRELYCYDAAMMHYTKGVAHAALGDVSAAEAEQVLLREAAKRVPKSRQIHNVLCVQLLAVAEEMLECELAYRRGDHDAAFARLRGAIALEDDLPYDEPWG